MTSPLTPEELEALLSRVAPSSPDVVATATDPLSDRLHQLMRRIDTLVEEICRGFERDSDLATYRPPEQYMRAAMTAWRNKLNWGEDVLMTKRLEEVQAYRGDMEARVFAPLEDSLLTAHKLGKPVAGQMTHWLETDREDLHQLEISMEQLTPLAVAVQRHTRCVSRLGILAGGGERFVFFFEPLYAARAEAFAQPDAPTVERYLAIADALLENAYCRDRYLMSRDVASLLRLDPTLVAPAVKLLTEWAADLHKSRTSVETALIMETARDS